MHYTLIESILNSELQRGRERERRFNTCRVWLTDRQTDARREGEKEKDESIILVEYYDWQADRQTQRGRERERRINTCIVWLLILVNNGIII